MAQATCSVDDCFRDVVARGWCMSHYNRWRSTGSPDGVNNQPGVCELCGVAVKPRRGGPTPTFCSQSCRRRSQYLRKRTAILAREKARRDAQRVLLNLTCEWCGETYERVRESRFCSNACRQRAADGSTENVCSAPECDRGVRARGMCSKHWKAWARAEGRVSPDPWTDRRRANYHKRRARKRALPAESVKPTRVYERDEWMCGICGQPVDPEVAYPDMMSASLDHIVPLAAGGHHTYENTQLAHYICNMRKGAHVLDPAAGAMPAAS